jgi:predicted site-specific integrase-resolvase
MNRSAIELLCICHLKQIEIVALHQQEARKFEHELVEDVLAILTIYSAKIYGKRSHMKRNKKK